MKAVARQYFWWPKLDKHIEDFVRNCEACKKVINNPEKAPLIKFPKAKFPFDRIHVDFADPFKGKMYLIIVDSFSKWTEIYEMSNTSAENTIEKLRDCFARFGLPCMIFSDNGKQFVSAEFANFCKNNSIQHKTSAPYHPSTNGLAENAVGAFKKGILKALADKKNSLTTTTLISRYLASYRNAPHTSTGESPAKIMFGRDVRTRLSLLARNEREKARERQVRYFRGNCELDLCQGDIVFVRDYKNPAKPTWRKAVIKSKLGYRTYLCITLDEEKLTWKRHVNQIIKAGTFYRKEEAYFDSREGSSEDNSVRESSEKESSERPKRIIKPIKKLNL